MGWASQSTISKVERNEKRRDDKSRGEGGRFLTFLYLLALKPETLLWSSSCYILALVINVSTAPKLAYTPYMTPYRSHRITVTQSIICPLPLSTQEEISGHKPNFPTRCLNLTPSRTVRSRPMRTKQPFWEDRRGHTYIHTYIHTAHITHLKRRVLVWV